MSNVQIRSVSDLAGEAELCDQLTSCWADVSNAGGAVGFPFLPVSIEQVSEATDRLAVDVDAGAVIVFVAEADKKVVGWVSLRLNRSELTQHWGSVERLQSRPEFRGQGVGKRLMETLVDHSRSSGLEQLRLVLRGGKNLEAFYSRLGWVEIGRHPAALRLSTSDKDEVSMLLTISDRPGDETIEGH